MNKLVILAPNGQVGFELLRSLAPLGEVIALSREDVDFILIDKLEEKIKHIAPSIIINAAAYTAVDKAESDEQAAFIINEKLPRMLAKICNDNDALLVHYSSDYVYPGNGEIPWTETDNTAPLSVYGKSKLAGDKAIISHCSKYLIFRTSWVYAARGNNFMKTMIKLAQSRESLNVVNDQFGAPTPARLIAQVTALAVAKMLEDADSAKMLSGIYHLAPSGYTSWHGFADEIFSRSKKCGVSLQLKESQFKGIPTEAYPTPAQRPKNSRMNLDKIEKTFGLTMPTWQSQLALTLEEYLQHQQN